MKAFVVVMMAMLSLALALPVENQDFTFKGARRYNKRLFYDSHTNIPKTSTETSIQEDSKDVSTTSEESVEQKDVNSGIEVNLPSLKDLTPPLPEQTSEQGSHESDESHDPTWTQSAENSEEDKSSNESKSSDEERDQQAEDDIANEGIMEQGGLDFPKKEIDNLKGVPAIIVVGLIPPMSEEDSTVNFHEMTTDRNVDRKDEKNLEEIEDQASSQDEVKNIGHDESEEEGEKSDSEDAGGISIDLQPPHEESVWNQSANEKNGEEKKAADDEVVQSTDDQKKSEDEKRMFVKGVKGVRRYNGGSKWSFN